MEQNKEKKNNKGKTFLIRTAEGITLGISAAVAGLSAGTIAVAERCYDTIVDSIADIKKQFKKSILTLLPFLLGGLLGALLAFFGIKYGYDAVPFTITGLFGGFIIGSLPVALSELRKGDSAKSKLIHVTGFVLCLGITAALGIVTALKEIDLGAYLNNRVWWRYILALVAGFIAAAACVIPGISGSMTLRVMGRYYPIINTFIGQDSIFHSDDKSFILTGLAILLLLIVGALLGLIFSSKFRKLRLSKHRVSTFYCILGLILGSFISRFINSSIYPKYPERQLYDLVLGIILFIVGAALTFLLVRYVEKKKKLNPTKEEAQ